MQPARVRLIGDGLPIDATSSHPAGRLFSGGYDADLNELFAASVMGHPGGVAAAGGDPSGANVSGLRVLMLPDGNVYWADDSMSLPRGLNSNEIAAIQNGLQLHFRNQSVTHIARLEDIRS